MAMDRSLPDRAEVVIIGGGVMGASTAFHLAEAGVTDVLLLEADQLSCGSTSKSAGGVRLQFSDEINIALALRSMDAFERFGERPGADIGLKQVGYLFLLTDPDDVTVFEQNTALQNSMGVPSRMISAAEAGRLSTLAYIDDVLAASICMRDGHATPDAVVLGYAGAARSMGVEIATQCPVTGIDVEDGQITGVRTAHGRVLTSTVICVAGGVVTRHCCDRRSGSAGETRCSADLVHGADAEPPRQRADDDRLRHRLLLPFRRSGFAVRDGRHRAAAGVRRSDACRLAGGRRRGRRPPRPALLDVGIAGGWHGYYETTPDHNALIGEASHVSRFLYATGFSGHGFLLGPAVGEVLRDLVLGHTPPVDVSGFDVERFKGSTRPEHNIV